MTDLYISALQATAILSLILFLKVVVINLYLGYAKNNAGGRSPEDKYQQEEGQVTQESVQAQFRAQRMVNNDLENVPYGMILGWGALLCINFVQDEEAKDSYSLTHIVAFTTFVVGRVLHSLFYAFAVSLFRSLSYLLGVIAMFAISVNAVIASLNIESSNASIA